MDLTEDEQSLLIESSAIQWLASEYDFAQRKSSVSAPFACSDTVWAAFSAMGWLALPLPESAGGLGGRPYEVGLLMRAMGRHLVVEPYAPSVLLASRLLALHAKPEQCAQWLPALMAGDCRAALAHDEPDQQEHTAPRTTRARKTARGWRLQGDKLLVAGGPGSRWLLVTAATDAPESRAEIPEHRAFMLSADHPGITLRPCALADGRRAADLHLRDVEIKEDALIGSDTDISDTLKRVLAEAGLAACWEASGAMQAMLEMTLDYTAQREQFGQPLARFQVVAHRLAEIAVRCEEALAACQLASLRAERDLAELSGAHAMARSKVGRCAEYVARECVQLHGAMGVSDEYPVASYFRMLDTFRHQAGPTRLHSLHFARQQLLSGSWRQSRTLVDADLSPPSAVLTSSGASA